MFYEEHLANPQLTDKCKHIQANSVMASVASSPAYVKRLFDLIVTVCGTPHPPPPPSKKKKRNYTSHKEVLCSCCHTLTKMYSNLTDTTESGNLKLQTKITGPVTACLVFSTTESRRGFTPLVPPNRMRYKSYAHALWLCYQCQWGLTKQ